MIKLLTKNSKYIAEIVTFGYKFLTCNARIVNIYVYNSVMTTNYDSGSSNSVTQVKAYFYHQNSKLKETFWMTS